MDPINNVPFTDDDIVPAFSARNVFLVAARNAIVNNADHFDLTQIQDLQIQLRLLDEQAITCAEHYLEQFCANGQVPYDPNHRFSEANRALVRRTIFNQGGEAAILEQILHRADPAIRPNARGVHTALDLEPYVRAKQQAVVPPQPVHQDAAPAHRALMIFSDIGRQNPVPAPAQPPQVRDRLLESVRRHGGIEQVTPHAPLVEAAFEILADPNFRVPAGVAEWRVWRIVNEERQLREQNGPAWTAVAEQQVAAWRQQRAAATPVPAAPVPAQPLRMVDVAANRLVQAQQEAAVRLQRQQVEDRQRDLDRQEAERLRLAEVERQRVAAITAEAARVAAEPARLAAEAAERQRVADAAAAEADRVAAQNARMRGRR